eukprot:sb/3465443/
MPTPLMSKNPNLMHLLALLLEVVSRLQTDVTKIGTIERVRSTYRLYYRRSGERKREKKRERKTAGIPTSYRRLGVSRLVKEDWEYWLRMFGKKLGQQLVDIRVQLSIIYQVSLTLFLSLLSLSLSLSLSPSHRVEKSTKNTKNFILPILTHFCPFCPFLPIWAKPKFTGTMGNGQNKKVTPPLSKQLCCSGGATGSVVVSRLQTDVTKIGTIERVRSTYRLYYRRSGERKREKKRERNAAVDTCDDNCCLAAQSVHSPLGLAFGPVRELTDVEHVKTIASVVNRSREESKGIKMCSVLALVGVDTHEKSLTHLPLRIGLRTFHWCHFVGNGQVLGGRRPTFKLYLQPFSRKLTSKVLKIGSMLQYSRTPVFRDLRGKSFCPVNHFARYIVVKYC